ncbi:MAG: DUF1669 domain-containing protein, partial [Paludibacteraceae bacterium]|nr:DUF1669 domain-containing protein [Paludibacteraceae bacterium]
MTTAHFEHIQDHIIQELKKAHKNIEIAVAWFTNYDLFQTLMEARSHGVVVSVLIQDDVINR